MINQQLLDYVRSQLSQGVTKEKIISVLTSNGWTTQDVEEGFKALATPTTPISQSINLSSAPAVQTKTHTGRNVFFAVTVLFLLAGGASAYYFRSNLVAFPIVKSVFGIKDTTTETAVVDTNQVQNLSTINQDIKITQPTVTNGVADCGTDINCFINEAKICTPSTATIIINNNDGQGAITVDSEKSQILGYVGGNCHFTTTTQSYLESQDQNFLKQAVASGKYTQAQIDTMNTSMPQLTEQINKENTGTIKDCNFTTQDLTNILNYWQSPSGNGYGMIEDELMQDYCKTTLNTGHVIDPTKKIPTQQADSSQAPVISDISGPQALKINQDVTWKITVVNPTKGNLSYFIGWGEGGGESSMYTGQTFSHRYIYAGTYNIAFSVTNSSGLSAEKNFKVVVANEIAKVPIVTLSANPTTATSGGYSTLTWKAENATSCVFNDGNSTLSKSEPTSGSIKVGPLTKPQNMYAVWCENSDGKANALVSVSIPSILPIITFTADSLTIPAGGSTTIRWSTKNATSCMMGDGWDKMHGNPLPTSGSYKTSGGTYGIDCMNDAGRSSAMVSVYTDDNTSTNGTTNVLPTVPVVIPGKE